MSGWEVGPRYEMIKKIGKGTYGSVYPRHDQKRKSGNQEHQSSIRRRSRSQTHA